MRQVRTRLLKFNNLEDSSESDQEVKKMPPPPPNSASGAPPAPIQAAKKKESKWGKVSSSEPTFMPSNNAPPSKPAENQNLSL
jgi:hypothetical protein